MRGYIKRNLRAINGHWIEGVIRKGEQKEKENDAFDFFCSKLQTGSNLEKAIKETEKEYEEIPIVSEEIPLPFKKEKTIKIIVG